MLQNVASVGQCSDGVGVQDTNATAYSDRCQRIGHGLTVLAIAKEPAAANGLWLE